MTEHPLANFLREAAETADEHERQDVVQGSIEVLDSTGRSRVGQVIWVSEDGQAFSLLRIFKVDGRGHEVLYSRSVDFGWALAEVPHHYSTAFVVEAHYYRAGA